MKSKYEDIEIRLSLLNDIILTSGNGEDSGSGSGSDSGGGEFGDDDMLEWVSLDSLYNF